MRHGRRLALSLPVYMAVCLAGCLTAGVRSAVRWCRASRPSCVRGGPWATLPGRRRQGSRPGAPRTPAAPPTPPQPQPQPQAAHQHLILLTDRLERREGGQEAPRRSLLPWQNDDDDDDGLPPSYLAGVHESQTRVGPLRRHLSHTHHHTTPVVRGQAAGGMKRRGAHGHEGPRGCWLDAPEGPHSF